MGRHSTNLDLDALKGYIMEILLILVVVGLKLAFLQWLDNRGN